MRPTQVLQRRVRHIKLTTKHVNGGYYKGTGSGSMGSHTKHGGYVIDPNKVRTYVVPEKLADFKLTPFVTKNMDPLKGKFTEEMGPISGVRYLKYWKENGAGF